MNIPKKVLERFFKEVGKFQKVLEAAQARDINESDTVSIITDMLADVFGFDKYTEITREFAIRGTYCDLAIKVDDQVNYLIEVKAIGLSLKENHLRQALQYGSTEGIPWVVLTNGVTWQIHKIIFEKPVRSELICCVDFTQINPRKSEDQEKLFLLCREGIVKNVMDAFHERAQSVNKFMIAAIIMGDEVTKIIRRELRKITPGLKVEESEIADLIRSDVMKREVVDGDEAKAAAAKLKKANKPKKAKTTGDDS